MTQPLLLTKHHGLGNDFLVALESAAPLDGDDARTLCHRREGIGADGLIVAHPTSGDASTAPGGATTDVAAAAGHEHRWTMVLWNADGGRAEISGNGIRCLGQAIARRLKLDRAEPHRLIIDTDAGPRTLELRPALDGPADELWVRVGMGPAVDGPAPSDRWASVGVEPLDQAGVDIGNPHLVAFVPESEPFDMAVVGPAVEADYPDGLNVHLVEVVDRGRLRLKVWERGAGVTQACGSGACAAGWAAHRLDLVDPTVVVSMPGGEATVELHDPDEVRLVGPATYVGEVIVDG